MPKAQCKKALEAVIKSIGHSLRAGKSVVLTGFGTFAVFFAVDGLQNGGNDGFALVNTVTNTVVQLLVSDPAIT